VFRELDPKPNFVKNEIAEPLAAVSQNPEQALINEIGEQDRIASLHSVVNWVG
jgi:hypothetical protein